MNHAVFTFRCYKDEIVFRQLSAAYTDSFRLPATREVTREIGGGLVMTAEIFLVSGILTS
jgi:hypothetical protein